MREPWFRRHNYFGYWPINQKGWVFNAAFSVAASVFLLICVFLTSLYLWLAVILIPVFAFSAFRLNAIIDNRTRKA